MKKIYNLAVAASCLMPMLLTTATAHAASIDGAPSGYQPPIDTSGLQIIELLPHSQSCSPTDADLLCGDYVKLFNGADVPVNLANYRLRTSYGGTTSSSRNTFSLNGNLEVGQYGLVNTKDDGTPLSLTQSGGYVWLEDVYGVQTYEPIIQYPDASADSKVGQAWSFDGLDWRWTSSPQPDGPNNFPSPTTTEGIISSPSTSELKPCAPDQVRNPATNRCRKIVSASKTLTACKPGESRNPATNRCRSVKSATKSLTPCKPGQTRNLATNRCHSVASATKVKKPCKPGQERNPETGRCRKVQPQIAPVHDIKTASKTDGQHWYLIAVIVIVAGTYTFYEWRQEISASTERLRLKLRFPGGQKTQNLVK